MTGLCVSILWSTRERKWRRERWATMAASAALTLGPISLRSQRRQDFLDAFPKNLLSDQNPSRGRRKGAIFSVVASANDGEGGRGSGSGAGRFYFNITGFPFPLGPFLNRRTIRTEVAPLPFSSYY